MIFKTATTEDTTCFFEDRSFSYMWTGRWPYSHSVTWAKRHSFGGVWNLNFSWSLVWRKYL